MCGSTADVSHESKPSSVVEPAGSRSALESREAGRRDDRCEDLRLLGSRRVLDEMGRTTCDSDERMELRVSVAERPPLDPGGDREAMDSLVRRVLDSLGTVW